MNTIGIGCRRRVSSCCRSGPDMPAIATSRMRQWVWLTNSDARNASADENAWTAKPNCRSKSGSDSRTDSSSSTTETSERWTITNASCGCRVRRACGIAGNGERERGAGAVIRFTPQTATMLFDNRSADGQSDAHATALGGEEGLKELVHDVGLEANADILHRQPYP